MRTRTIALVGVATGLLVAAPAAAARDYASFARDIIPSGQYQSSSIPGAATQAQMYDGLTPLFRNVTPTDLNRYFKPESLRPARVVRTERIPGRPGLVIRRDPFGVPHVYGRTDDDVTFGAGYLIAEDRSLLLDFARYNGRLAAIDAPNISAIRLITSAATFKPTAQTNREVAKQTDAVRATGAHGRQLLHDIDVYLKGINTWYRKNEPTAAPFTRNDIYAINAVKGQFLGQGGGAEVGNAEFLDGLEAKLGTSAGLSVFTDLKQRNDPEHPYSVPNRAPYQVFPSEKGPGNVILRNGTYEAWQYDALAAPASKASVDAANPKQRQASNVLLVSGKRTATGHPLMVGGPQIGYNFPGLTYEMGLHGPHIEVLGATSAPFPGYMLIGRGVDYAWTLTSAESDIIDMYAETLCGGSDTKYLYRGQCRSMTRFDAGTLTSGGQTHHVAFWRTVHGSVVGYAIDAATGKRVAISRKRSSYGKDVVDQEFFQQMTYGRVRSFRDFAKAATLTPQTFNSFYADSRHIGVYTSGLLPLRPRGATGDLPVDGRGGFEWTGFLAASKHPMGEDPPNGLIVNWNNKAARDYPASDDRWGEGSIARVQLLLDGLNRHPRNTLATVTGAMNAAATQDVRAVVLWPILRDMLAKASPPSARAQQMAILLQQWHDQGGSRLDLNGDGLIDAPGAAIMDTAWTGLANAAMCGKLGAALCDQLATRMSRFDTPPAGQYNGWHQYMSKDFRTILGRPVRGKFANRYCGGGSAPACAQSLWAAIDAAGATLASQQGNDPAKWHESAVPEQIHFSPIPLITMRYTNRPSGIQQVISFSGHRPAPPKPRRPRRPSRRAVLPANGLG